jgi:hypothetical protein
MLEAKGYYQTQLHKFMACPNIDASDTATVCHCFLCSSEFVRVCLLSLIIAETLFLSPIEFGAHFFDHSFVSSSVFHSFVIHSSFIHSCFFYA